MKRTVSTILYMYFIITFAIFVLELYFEFGNPLFIVGQWFFVFGISSIQYHTFMYLVTIIGAYILLYTLNIWSLDWFYLRYIVVALFPFIPMFVLFSEWNDKNRIMRKGGVEIEAIYKGTDKFTRSVFEFYLDAKKYKVSANRYYRENNYNKNEKVKIIVSTKNPEKIYNYPPNARIKTLKNITIFLLVICVPTIILMLLE